MTYILILFVFAVIVFCFSLQKNGPKQYGDQGEREVQLLLKQLNKKEYKVVHDVLLRFANGHFSQIDHIVISKFGVFVIETKNYSGVVFGSQEDQRWIRKSKWSDMDFYSPILQNEGHIRALRRIFYRVNKESFIPIVAFSDRCTLRLNTTSPVVNFRQLVKVTLSYREPLLSDDEVQKLYNLLHQANVTDPKIRAEHIKKMQHRSSGRSSRVAK